MTDTEVAAKIQEVKELSRDQKLFWNCDAVQNELAAEYGHRRGWLHSTRDYSVRALIEGKVHARINWDLPRIKLPLFDHPYFYRDARRRAIALVSHVYTRLTDEAKTEALKQAETMGLTVEFPDDFPSWWSPGRTALVVYRRAAPNRG